MADEVARGLLVRVGEHLLLVPIGAVEEVCDVPPVTRIPRSAPHLVGLVAIRGRVLPLWDGAGLLGLAGPRQPSTCVRLTLDGTGIVLLVDGVEGLRQPSGSTGAGRGWWAAGSVLLPVGPDGVEQGVAVLDTAALRERVAA